MTATDPRLKIKKSEDKAPKNISVNRITPNNQYKKINTSNENKSFNTITFLNK